MNTLDIFLEMPWKFYALMGTVIVLVIWAIWFSSKRPTDFNHLFYDHWMKRINDDFRGVRRRYKRADRAEAYKATYYRIYHDLAEVTGGPEYFALLPTAQRSVWIHLFTRTRDVLYFS